MMKTSAIRFHDYGGPEVMRFAQLAHIASLIDAGKVTTTVAAVFPLAEAGAAQELSKLGHTRGKIILRAVA